MTTVTQQWRKGTSITAGWDFTVKHPLFARVYAFVAFGSDYRRWYADLEQVRPLVEDAEVLDVPCGGGAVFPRLAGTAPRRYVGADVSPAMLELAKKEAAKSSIRNLELIEADVVTMPYQEEFDLCLSYMGLHCMPDPSGAIAAMGRALHPGGMLRGSSVIIGEGWKNDQFVSLWQRRKIFTKVYSRSDLHGLLETAGFEDISIECSGAIAYFSGRRSQDV